MNEIIHHDENSIELFCEECGAEFQVEHEMGLDYIPHYCTFCGAENYREEEPIEIDDEALSYAPPNSSAF